MNHYIPSSRTTKLDKVMNPEQFAQIIEAIIAGKYSWACVLLLRFAGHNPLHYIPYRTYNRLIKENDQTRRQIRHETNSANSVNQRSVAKYNDEPLKSSGSSLEKISDLSYFEISEQHTQVRGGNIVQHLSRNIKERSSVKIDLLQHKINHFMSATNDLFQKLP